MIAFGIADGGKSILRENSEGFFQKSFLLRVTAVLESIPNARISTILRMFPFPFFPTNFLFLLLQE